MEWSRVPGNQKKKKKKKKNPLQLHLAGRCDLFWKTPPPLFKEEEKSPEPYACKVCFSATHGRYSTMRRNWRENEFFTFGQTLLFFSSHDGRIPFLEGGLSVFPRRWSNNGEIQLLADPYCRPDELACLHHHHHRLLHCGCSGTGRWM